MLFQALVSWKAVIDGIQILLILVILILLLRNRTLDRQKAFKEKKTDDPPRFNAEVLTQAMQQQLEQAFANIIATVRIEISNLERVLQSGQMKSQKPSEGGLQPLARMSSPSASDFSGWEDRHKHIEKLAGRGVSIQHISEEFKIPKAEIELILNLKKDGT